VSLRELIQEAERVRKRGAGVSDFLRQYDKMLSTLKRLSARIEMWDNV